MKLRINSKTALFLVIAILLSSLVLALQVPNTGDYDNDGDDDIVAFQIINNQNNGTYFEVNEYYGIVPENATYGFFIDLNKSDSYLDVYLVYENNTNKLLRYNSTSSNFTDITATAGVGGNESDPIGANTADFNNDGRADLYANNKLYISNGDYTFNDSTNLSNLAEFPRLQWVVAWDFNEDNRTDIIGVSERGNITLMLNLGDSNSDNVPEFWDAIAISRLSNLTKGVFANSIAVGWMWNWTSSLDGITYRVTGVYIPINGTDILLDTLYSSNFYSYTYAQMPEFRKLNLSALLGGNTTGIDCNSTDAIFGDFDNNSIMDIAVLCGNSTSSSITYLIRNGTGTYVKGFVNAGNPVNNSGIGMPNNGRGARFIFNIPNPGNRAPPALGAGGADPNDPNNKWAWKAGGTGTSGTANETGGSGIGASSDEYGILYLGGDPPSSQPKPPGTPGSSDDKPEGTTSNNGVNLPPATPVADVTKGTPGLNDLTDVKGSLATYTPPGETTQPPQPPSSGGRLNKTVVIIVPNITEEKKEEITKPPKEEKPTVIPSQPVFTVTDEAGSSGDFCLVNGDSYGPDENSVVSVEFLTEIPNIDYAYLYHNEIWGYDNKISAGEMNKDMPQSNPPFKLSVSYSQLLNQPVQVQTENLITGAVIASQAIPNLGQGETIHRGFVLSTVGLPEGEYPYKITFESKNIKHEETRTLTVKQTNNFYANPEILIEGDTATVNLFMNLPAGKGSIEYSLNEPIAVNGKYLPGKRFPSSSSLIGLFDSVFSGARTGFVDYVEVNPSQSTPAAASLKFPAEFIKKNPLLTVKYRASPVQEKSFLFFVGEGCVEWCMKNFGMSKDSCEKACGGGAGGPYASFIPVDVNPFGGVTYKPVDVCADRKKCVGCCVCYGYEVIYENGKPTRQKMLYASKPLASTQTKSCRDRSIWANDVQKCIDSNLVSEFAMLELCQPLSFTTTPTNMSKECGIAEKPEVKPIEEAVREPAKLPEEEAKVCCLCLDPKDKANPHAVPLGVMTHIQCKKYCNDYEKTALAVPPPSNLKTPAELDDYYKQLNKSLDKTVCREDFTRRQIKDYIPYFTNCEKNQIADTSCTITTEDEPIAPNPTGKCCCCACQNPIDDSVRQRDGLTEGQNTKWIGSVPNGGMCKKESYAVCTGYETASYVCQMCPTKIREEMEKGQCPNDEHHLEFEQTEYAEPIPKEEEPRPPTKGTVYLSAVYTDDEEIYYNDVLTGNYKPYFAVGLYSKDNIVLEDSCHLRNDIRFEGTSIIIEPNVVGAFHYTFPKGAFVGKNQYLALTNNQEAFTEENGYKADLVIDNPSAMLPKEGYALFFYCIRAEKIEEYDYLVAKRGSILTELPPAGKVPSTKVPTAPITVPGIIPGIEVPQVPTTPEIPTIEIPSEEIPPTEELPTVPEIPTVTLPPEEEIPPTEEIPSAEKPAAGIFSKTLHEMVSGRKVECSDLADNDFDSYIDFPKDPGCRNAYDDEEEDEPAKMAIIKEMPANILYFSISLPLITLPVKYLLIALLALASLIAALLISAPTKKAKRKLKLAVLSALVIAGIVITGIFALSTNITAAVVFDEQAAQIEETGIAASSKIMESGLQIGGYKGAGVSKECDSKAKEPIPSGIMPTSPKLSFIAEGTTYLIDSLDMQVWQESYPTKFKEPPNDCFGEALLPYDKDIFVAGIGTGKDAEYIILYNPTNTLKNVKKTIARLYNNKLYELAEFKDYELNPYELKAFKAPNEFNIIRKIDVAGIFYVPFTQLALFAPKIKSSGGKEFDVPDSISIVSTFEKRLLDTAGGIFRVFDLRSDALYPVPLAYPFVAGNYVEYPSSAVEEEEVTKDELKEPEYSGYIIQFREEPALTEYIKLKPVLEQEKQIALETKDFNKFKELESEINKKVKIQRTRVLDEHSKIFKDFGTDTPALTTLAVEDTTLKLNLSKEQLIGKYTDVFNGIALNITTEEAEELKKLPEVKNIYPNYEVQALLMDSIPLINADKVWQLKDNQGREVTGKDVTIAIIDTGIDYTHPDLGKTVIEERDFEKITDMPLNVWAYYDMDQLIAMDRNRIAYYHKNTIYIYSFETNTYEKTIALVDSVIRLALKDNLLAYFATDKSLNTGVYLYNLDTGIHKKISVDYMEDIGNIAISNNKVIYGKGKWIDEENLIYGSNIYVYDVLTEETTTVVKDSVFMYHPVVSGSNIAYAVVGRICYDKIVVYDMNSGKEKELTPPDVGPVLDFENGKILYVACSKTNFDRNWRTYYLYDINTGEYTRLAAPAPEEGEGNNSNIKGYLGVFSWFNKGAIGKDVIFFSKDVNANKIIAYDLNQDRYVQINLLKISGCIDAQDNKVCFIANDRNIYCHLYDPSNSYKLPENIFNQKVVGGYDFVNSDDDPMDDNGHGTHVAATTAGNGALKGVAPDAELYAYKVLNKRGSGYMNNVISAIEMSVDPNQDGDFSDHIDIISMSLGGSGNPDDAVSQAVDNAVDAGVVVVAAAGNSGPDESSIKSPGTARKAITVGAIDKKDKIATFSSRGPVVWEDKDGITQYLIKPDIVAPGVDICAAQFDSAWEDRKCYDDKHVAISGTSMATPHVAGAVALLLQKYPNAAPNEIKDALKNSSINLGYDSNTQGSGKMDILKAVVPATSEAVGSNIALKAEGTTCASAGDVYRAGYGYGCYNAIDSNSNTFWSISANGKYDNYPKDTWIKLDLAKETWINKIVLKSINIKAIGWIRNGTLTLYDSSGNEVEVIKDMTIPYGRSVPTGITIPISPKKIKSARFDVIQTWGPNAGLSEFEIIAGEEVEE